MNKKFLIIGLVAILIVGAGVVIAFGQINKNTPSQKENQGKMQEDTIKGQIQAVDAEFRQKMDAVTEKQKQEGCIEQKDVEMTKTLTGEKIIEKQWHLVSTEGVCGDLFNQKEELAKERSSQTSQLQIQLDLLTARSESERGKAMEAIKAFMAKPDLQLQYMGTRHPSNFNVGVVTNQTDGGYTMEDVDGWERKVEVYQQKEYIGNTCEVYEYEVDVRNNDIVQVGIRYPQEGVIANPKKQSECQDTRSLETPILLMADIKDIAMGYVQRGIKNFDAIKDKFIYEGSADNPKTISAHNAWIYENKDYKLPEGLFAEAPSKVPTIWSRVSSGGYLIMYLNTTRLFNYN
jgi:hypothetical protein